MARPIKFRAWEKDISNMIGWVDLNLHSLHKFFENENYIVMQFTGLKDKHGKEIYEGDIVTNGKLKGDVKLGEYKHYFGDSFSLAIGFYLDGDDYFYLSEILKNNDFSNIEIIGNIYEKK